MEVHYLYEIAALVLLVAAALAFFIIPDHRAAKKLRREVQALQPGDRITTKNGMVATVERVEGDVALVTTGPDKVQLEVALWGIESVEGAHGAQGEGRVSRITSRTAEKAR